MRPCSGVRNDGSIGCIKYTPCAPNRSRAAPTHASTAGRITLSCPSAACLSRCDVSPMTDAAPNTSLWVVCSISEFRQTVDHGAAICCSRAQQVAMTPLHRHHGEPWHGRGQDHPNTPNPQATRGASCINMGTFCAGQCKRAQLRGWCASATQPPRWGQAAQTDTLELLAAMQPAKPSCPAVSTFGHHVWVRALRQVPGWCAR